MDRETLSILTNKDVIAINQDKLGIQGRRYMKIEQHEIWVKQLSDGEAAVCFFNRDEQPWTFEYQLGKTNPISTLRISGFGNWSMMFMIFGTGIGILAPPTTI